MARRPRRRAPNSSPPRSSSSSRGSKYSRRRDTLAVHTPAMAAEVAVHRLPACRRSRSPSSNTGRRPGPMDTGLPDPMDIGRLDRRNSDPAHDVRVDAPAVAERKPPAHSGRIHRCSARVQVRWRSKLGQRWPWPGPATGPAAPDPAWPRDWSRSDSLCMLLQ